MWTCCCRDQQVGPRLPAVPPLPSAKGIQDLPPPASEGPGPQTGTKASHRKVPWEPLLPDAGLHHLLSFQCWNGTLV